MTAPRAAAIVPSMHARGLTLLRGVMVSVMLAVLLAALLGGAVAAARLPRLGSSRYDVHLISASVRGGAVARAGRSPVQVLVRTRRPVAGLSVTVNRRRSALVRVARRGSLRWIVSVPPRLLRAGSNRVLLTARAGRSRGIAVVFVRYLLPARGLVRMLTPRPGATVSSALAVNLSLDRRAFVRGWLNGPLDRRRGAALAAAQLRTPAGERAVRRRRGPRAALRP
jgi:hypothetical protein